MIKLYFSVFLCSLTFITSSNGNTISYTSIFEHKKILITGGTGFIGQALVKHILRYNPDKVIVFSRDEVKHHKIREKIQNPKLENIIGDIRDYDALSVATQGVDIVIHAAALKRIDALECNVRESVQTNIIGTMNVVHACTQNKVSKVLFISSDKACSPVNIYGACKFVSEKIFTNMIPQNSSTCFLVVRYGNVLQSTGSVIPYFHNRIMHDQEIPLTDPQMTRFFINKKQAIELISKALYYGQGGEIFVPHIPAFRLVDLIEVLQEKLNKKVAVNIIGIRPGEKIDEVMINSTEISRTYQFQDMFIITPSIPCNKRLYAQYGSPLQDNNFTEYSSHNHTLSRDALNTLLHTIITKE